MTGPNAAIEARALTRRYGDLTAVDRVSFAVRPGEIFCTRAPNREDVFLHLIATSLS